MDLVSVERLKAEEQANGWILKFKITSFVLFQDISIVFYSFMVFDNIKQFFLTLILKN